MDMANTSISDVFANLSRSLTVLEEFFPGFGEYYNNVQNDSTETRTTIGDFHDAKWLSFFVAITFVFVFGALGNIATVLSIWRNKSLHTPTFMAIGCLTFSDIFAVTSRYVALLKSFYLEGPSSSWLFSLIYTLSLSLYICSTLHILLLTVMRFMLIVYPIRSLSLVTNGRIRCVSYLIWMISITTCIPYLLTMEEAYRTKTADYLVETIVSFILAVIPSVIIISLHCAKLRAMSEQTTCHLHPHQARAMSYLVGFILGFQVIATVPSLIHFAFLFIKTSDSSVLGTAEWFEDFKLFVAFTMLINHAADPLFYFALTPSARRMCRRNWDRTKTFYKKYSVSVERHTHSSTYSADHL